MTTDITRYSPDNAPYQRETTPHIEATVAAAFDLLKKKNPKRHQHIEIQRAFARAQKPAAEALLHNPDFMEIIDSLIAATTATERSIKMKLLGVAVGATKREIYNAYRRKARKLHPDVGGSVEQFQQLQDAYHTLLKHAPKT